MGSILYGNTKHELNFVVAVAMEKVALHFHFKGKQREINKLQSSSPGLSEAVHEANAPFQTTTDSKYKQDVVDCLGRGTNSHLSAQSLHIPNRAIIHTS